MKKTVKLKPYCKKIGSGITPRGGDSVYIESGVSLIRSQNVYNSSFSTKGLAFIDNDIAQKMKGVTLEKEDILLNITGDSVARCCKVPKSLLPARVNQHVSIIRTNKDTLNSQFLMYFLISPQMQSTMLSLAGSGGTRKALTKEMIENFNIPLVDYTKQEKIAEILSNYDDLININHQKIQLLEESARLLFREWFVFFHFPGHEKVKIVDGVPEGWKKERLNQIWDIRYGNNLPTTKIHSRGKYPVFGADSIIGYYDKHNVEDKMCLVTCRGNGSGNVRRTFGPSFVTNNSFIFKSNSAYLHMQFFFTMFILENLQLKNQNTGSAQPQLTLSNIAKLKVLVPKKSIILQYTEIVKYLYQALDNLRIQNQKLAQARDLLLPRLMSGEIEV